MTSSDGETPFLVQTMISKNVAGVNTKAQVPLFSLGIIPGMANKWDASVFSVKLINTISVDARED